MVLDAKVCQSARLSRDSRFDGKFFTAVLTTGIYCRPICPATPPKEENVQYFETAVAAANAGFRPCLRCRPDSAPGSSAWAGTDTTLRRAVRLIHEGALADGSLVELADRLGISDRYLRKLFQQKLGVSPKQYALYQQLLLAKQLLHRSRLPITDIALATGFGSVRRFNDCFAKNFRLTPSAIRRSDAAQTASPTKVELFIGYRPPFRWDLFHGFVSHRLIAGLEWLGDDCYGRTFEYQGVCGHFTLVHRPARHGFELCIESDAPLNLMPVVHRIRRMLDLDCDSEQVTDALSCYPALAPHLVSGLRIPGVWTPFEAGIRAILGQQVSVKAATNLVTQLVAAYGGHSGQRRVFPTPAQLAVADMDILKMPNSRRQTLTAFSRYQLDHPETTELDDWLAIKGIGPWTVNYAKMRGQGDCDIWLGSDLGVKNALKRQGIEIDPELAAPWRSYLTLQLWQLL